MSGAIHDLDGFEVVRGGAAPEELAAVLAVIAARAEQAERPVAGYAAWRARRLAAIRRSCSPAWLNAQRHR